mgnify:CR=1 FL=1
MKVGDLVKSRNNRSRNPLFGVIFAIELPDPIYPAEGDRYVVRWQGLGSHGSPFTQRCWHRDIQVLSEG